MHQKGNLADAEIDAWSETVSDVKKAYPELKHVVPGHGLSGGVDLLEYTIGFIYANSRRQIYFFLA